MTGYGTLAWWDTGRREPGFVELPGPRFLRELPDEVPDGVKAFVSIKASGLKAAAAEAACAEAKAAGRIVDYEVVPDPADLEAAAHAAASAARSAQSLGEQLAQYVMNSMVITTAAGDDGARARVLALARKYLGV